MDKAAKAGTGWHLRLGVLSALLALALIALAIPPANAEPTDHDLRPVSLQLRWHHQFQFAGYYMAQRLGYYRDAGLDVDIRAGGRNVSPLREVVEGQAQFGIDGSGLLVARDRGQPVVAVAALLQKSPLRLFARRDNGIDTIEDLAGRRVMLLPGHRSLALVAMLDQARMLDRITRVDSSTNIHDLIVGNVDAFNGYDSNEPFLLRRAGIPITEFDPAAYGIQLYSDVLFTRQDTARSDPELVEAFRDASLRGWQYALNNPEVAIQVIRDHYRSTKSSEHLRFEAAAIHRSMMPELVEPGHMSELRWLKIRDQLAELGLVKPDLPVRPFLFHPPGHVIDWPSIQPYLLLAAALIALAFAVTAFVIRKNLQLRDEIAFRQAAEHRAQHLATHDCLTGLPNRLLLMDRLGNSLRRARRHDHTPMLAFIDLDHFKQLNDNHGHERGDRLLRDIATEVTRITRAEDTFARMGGDEFVLLIDHMPRQYTAAEARRLLAAVQAAMSAPDIDVPVGASIGVLLIAAPDAVNPDTALRIADELMYEVKRGARNNYRIALFDGEQTVPIESPEGNSDEISCSKRSAHG